MSTDAHLGLRLAASFSAAPDRLRALHGRLAEAASAEGLLDVAYRTLDTPIGSLLLAATDRGLVRVGLPAEDPDVVLLALAERVSPRVLHAPGRLDDAARELEEYFGGRRRAFDLRLDWRLSTGYRSTVLHHLPEIAYGHVASYAEVARMTDSPKAVRAVGSACATNPLPVVIPCHRVVRSDGGLGGYLGGVDAKRTLLALEGAA
jgi:methylated-DNA-[protein]-cysteine S-methyltransferase